MTIRSSEIVFSLLLLLNDLSDEVAFVEFVVGAVGISMAPPCAMKVGDVDVLGASDGEKGFESWAAFSVDEVDVEDATESIP